MGKKAQPPPDEGGESVPLWYVSYADMITLLLALFVMLTTFSSYDDEHLGKFTGAIRSVAEASIFPSKMAPRSNFLRPADREVDFTATGSRLPDQMDDTENRNPKVHPPVKESEAYFSRKVLTLPLNGVLDDRDELTAEGKAKLDRLAAFLRAVPCQVLIAQPPNGESLSHRVKDTGRLRRAERVVSYFTGPGKLPAGRFGLYCAPQAQPNPYAGNSVLEMTLVTGGIYSEQ